MLGNVNAIREAGFKVLSKELGVAGMAVFMKQFETGIGNYTDEREALHKNAPFDDIVASIQLRNNSLD